MLGRISISALVMLAFTLAACAQGRDYPTNRRDEAYDLKAMSLINADLPQGMVSIGGGVLNNLQWADTFNPADEEELDALVNQLVAQGRISASVKQFAWFEPGARNLRDAILPHLGQPHLFTVQSTLYTEEKLAMDSTRSLCGIQANERDPVEEFKVPMIGDQSAGFYSVGQLGDFGKLLETTVCFRTGRIVHAVIQQGLVGTQDIPLSVRLAQKMLARVNDSFDGKAPPVDPEDEKKPG